MADEERGLFSTNPELKTAESFFYLHAVEPRNGGIPRRLCVGSDRRGMYVVNYKPGEVVDFPDSDKKVTVDRLGVTYHLSGKTVTQPPIKAIHATILELDDPDEIRQLFNQVD